MSRLINPWYWLKGEPLEVMVSRTLGDAAALNALLRKVIDKVYDVHAIAMLYHDGTLIDQHALEDYSMEKIAHFVAAYAALASEFSQGCGYGDCQMAWLKYEQVYLIVLPAPQILVALLHRRNFKI